MRHRAILFCLLMSLAFPLVAAEQNDEPGEGEEEKPLWELGMVAGALQVPDYPSSSRSRLRGLALPYIVYRGDVLRIGDGQSARAVAAENERFELSMSFDAAFDASSDENPLRAGMEDLDFLFELGPQLIYKAGEFEFDDGGYADLQLALQGRSVFSTDFRGIDHRGYIVEPMLRYRHQELFSPRLDVSVSLRPVWADRDLHAYFYQVDAGDETGTRPRYRAREGYFGSQLNVYATWHVTDRFRIFGRLEGLDQHGSVNRDSPLYDKDRTVSAGLGFIWSMFASERQVIRPRTE